MPAKAGIQGRNDSIRRSFHHRIPAQCRPVEHSAGSGDPAYN